MGTRAVSRLQKELQNFMTNPPPGLSASLIDDNIFKWHALIWGPKDTPFEEGIFRVEINFPSNYPKSPPTITFLSKMFHPNVGSDGSVCMDFLKEKWKNTFQTWDLLNALIVLLAEPNPGSALNGEARDLFLTHPNDRSYQRRVKEIVNTSEMFIPRAGADACKNYNENEYSISMQLYE